MVEFGPNLIQGAVPAASTLVSTGFAMVAAANVTNKKGLGRGGSDH